MPPSLSLLGIKVSPNTRKNCLLVAVASSSAGCTYCRRRIAVQRCIQIGFSSTGDACLATPTCNASSATLYILQIAIRLNKFQRDKISTTFHGNIKKKIIKDYAPNDELKNKLNTANKNYFNVCVNK